MIYAAAAILAPFALGAALWGSVALGEASDRLRAIFRAELGGRPRDDGGEDDRHGAVPPRPDQPAARVRIS